MTRLPSGEIHGGEPEPNLLGLELASSSVDDGGSGYGRVWLVTDHEISCAPCQRLDRR
jgi:hypothetical protein